MKKILLISGCMFLLDLFSKQLVVHFMREGTSISIIDNFFSLTYAKNTGVAFSLLEGNLGLIIVMTLFIIGVLFYYLKDNIRNKWDVFLYGLIVGGAFGNLVDRVFYGYVVDFLDFRIFGYSFPIFNLADSMIVIGVILLVLVEVVESRGKDEVNGRRKNEN